MTDSATLTVGMLLFPGVTQLDLTGPYEVFSRMPRTRVVIIAATLDPVRTEFGLTITPDVTFGDAPRLDVMCVPGGWGVDALLADAVFLGFLRSRSSEARFIVSVCSGALLLGAAGLLEGYRATTHWMSLELLSLLGAEPVAQRVVRDRNRITGAGVTAGIDLSLSLAAQLFGEAAAQAIQLAIEYAPDPPFNSGSPGYAPESVREAVMIASAPSLARRRAIIDGIVRSGASGT